MALSDNVIRCGLTPKFKDVDVLCDTLAYDTFKPEPKAGEDVGGNTVRYKPPVEDFEVRVTEFKAGEGGVVDELPQRRDRLQHLPPRRRREG